MSLTRNIHQASARQSETYPESSPALAAVQAAVAEAAGALTSESRRDDAILVADAERHMRLSRSWLARLNAATSPVVLDTVHAAVGPRAFTVRSACHCAVLLDQGTWLVRGAHITSVLGLPAQGRSLICDGECRDRWLVSVQDAAAVVDVFCAGDRIHRGALVRANSDSVDVATRQGVVTVVEQHLNAIRVVV